MIQLPEQRVQPVPSRTPRGQRGQHAEQPGPVLAGGGQPGQQPLAGRRAGHRDRALEAGHVERLGRRGQRHPVLGRRPAERDERRVPGAGQGERGMDLVGYHEDPVLLGQRRDPAEVVRAEHPPGRVVRVAEQVAARTRGECRLQPGEVELPAAALPDQRHLHHPPAVEADVLEERRVHRRVDDHAVARLGGQRQDGVEAGHHVRHQVHPPGVDRPAVPGRGERGERLADGRQGGVPAVAQVERRAQRRQHRLGHVVIHLGDERRQHIRRVEPPLLAAPPP